MDEMIALFLCAQQQDCQDAEKGGRVAGTIPVLAQRAVADSPRWTRAVGIIPTTLY